MHANRPQWYFGQHYGASPCIFKWKSISLVVQSTDCIQPNTIVYQNLILSHLHGKLLKAVVTCFSIAALSLILNQLWGSRCENSARSSGSTASAAPSIKFATITWKFTINSTLFTSFQIENLPDSVQQYLRQTVLSQQRSDLIDSLIVFHYKTL